MPHPLLVAGWLLAGLLVLGPCLLQPLWGMLGPVLFGPGGLVVAQLLVLSAACSCSSTARRWAR